MRILLTQPESRTGEMRADLAALLRDEPIHDCDIVVLPELIGGTADPEHYEATISDLAASWSCVVVGGSHYLPSEDGLINAGVVCDARGDVIARYHKARPYGLELGKGVVPGEASGLFELQGRTIAVFICSDLWFSDCVAGLAAAPDVVLVPSFSVTQKQDPSDTRELWKHMAVSRAYEHAAYLGVSDWAHACKLDGMPASGAAGMVNLRPPGDIYHTAQTEKLGVYELDFDRLDGFRENRVQRGFLRRACGDA